MYLWSMSGDPEATTGMASQLEVAPRVSGISDLAGVGKERSAPMNRKNDIPPLFYTFSPADLAGGLFVNEHKRLHR